LLCQHDLGQLDLGPRRQLSAKFLGQIGHVPELRHATLVEPMLQLAGAKRRRALA
jgi:hypothetical protein